MKIKYVGENNTASVVISWFHGCYELKLTNLT